MHYTLSEMARYGKVGQTTIWEHSRKPGFPAPAFSKGRSRYWDQEGFEAVLAYLKSRKVSGTVSEVR